MYKDYEIKLNAILDKHGVQKVELGLVDDLEKLLKTVEKEYKATDNSLNNWYEEVFSVNKKFAQVEKKYLNFNKTINKISDITQILKKEAKNLGLDANTIPAYKNAIAAQNRSGNLTDEFLTGRKASTKISGAL